MDSGCSLGPPVVIHERQRISASHCRTPQRIGFHLIHDISPTCQTKVRVVVIRSGPQRFERHLRTCLLGARSVAILASEPPLGIHVDWRRIRSSKKPSVKKFSSNSSIEFLDEVACMHANARLGYLALFGEVVAFVWLLVTVHKRQTSPAVEEEKRGEIESEVMVQTNLTKSERQASTKVGSLESDGLHRSGKLSMRFGFAVSKAMRNAMLEASRVAAAHRADS